MFHSSNKSGLVKKILFYFYSSFFSLTHQFLQKCTVVNFIHSCTKFTFQNLKMRSPLQKKVSDCKVATRDAFHLAATPKMHVLEHTGCPSMIWVNFKQQEVSITLTVKRAATVYANFYTLDHSYLKSENKKKLTLFHL